MKQKLIMKICIGGDGGTGKSTLIQTKRTGIFQSSTPITIGIDFACFPMLIEKESITFLIYDLGGQQRFRFLQNSFIIGSKGAIILYDLTREKTFDNIVHWYRLFSSESCQIPILVAGTKMDLVRNEDLQYFSTKWSNFQTKNPQITIIDHIFISSKNNAGVDDVFFLMGKYFLGNHSQSHSVLYPSLP